MPMKGRSNEAVATGIHTTLSREFWTLGDCHGLSPTFARGSRRDPCPELPGSRRERRQPLDLQIGARSEQIHPHRREFGEINLVAAPIGTTAVVVGEAV